MKVADVKEALNGELTPLLLSENFKAQLVESGIILIIPVDTPEKLNYPTLKIVGAFNDSFHCVGFRTFSLTKDGVLSVDLGISDEEEYNKWLQKYESAKTVEVVVGVDGSCSFKTEIKHEVFELNSCPGDSPGSAFKRAIAGGAHKCLALSVHDL